MAQSEGSLTITSKGKLPRKVEGIFFSQRSDAGVDHYVGPIETRGLYRSQVGSLLSMERAMLKDNETTVDILVFKDNPTHRFHCASRGVLIDLLKSIGYYDRPVIHADDYRIYSGKEKMMLAEYLPSNCPIPDWLR